MPSPSAVCKVNGFTLPTTGTTGLNVSAGSTLTIQLTNVSGVNTWDVDCTSSDGFNPLSAYTTIQSTKILNPSTFTATFTMPNLSTISGQSVGAALQFTSVVNAGQWNANTVTFGIWVLGSNHARMFFNSENLETNATYGVSPDLNQFFTLAGTPTGLAGGDLSGTYPNPTVSGLQNISLPSPTGTNTVLTYNSGAYTWSNTSNVTWANDLSPSTNTNQYVTSLSYSASSTGGTIAINGFNTLLEWSSTGRPIIRQAATSAAAGADFNISSQTTTFAGGNGGNLILSTGGGSGPGVAGYVHLQIFGSDALVIDSTKAITVSNFSGGSAGVVHASITGLLSSSTIVNADISTVAAIAVSKLANGTADQLLDTNHAGTTAEWFTLGGDATFVSHNLTVTGLQGQSLPAPTGTNTLLTWSGSVLSWSVNTATVTWASDLVNSTNSNQYVSSLSFSSSSAGGTIAINGTGSALQWATGNTAPTFNQASTSSGNGATFTIAAQNATGVSHNGGQLTLAGGTSGSATAGTVVLQTAGTTRLTAGAGGVITIANLSTGVVHSDSSGNLTSSTIVNADVSASAAIAVSKLAIGSADQLLDTNHGATTAEWFTLGGDATFASHNLTVTGLQGNALPAPTGTGTLLQWTGSALTWASSSGVAWANDLVNSSSSHQYVSAISFDGTGNGGIVNINGINTELFFANNVSAPTITQSQLVTSGSTAGITMTIEAQPGQANPGGTAGNGGVLLLIGGTNGQSSSGVDGNSGDIQVSSGLYTPGSGSGHAGNISLQLGLLELISISGATVGNITLTNTTAVPNITQTAQASTSGGNGAAGKNFSLTSQAGQAATGGSNTGGNGSQLIFTSGVGGSSGASTGGTGGAASLTAGAGGASNGSATTAGAGANATVAGGAGGSGAGGTNANGGAGGNAVINSGAGGAKSGSGTVGNAGNISLQLASTELISISGATVGNVTFTNTAAVPNITQTAQASTSGGSGATGNNFTITSQAGQAATGAAHTGGNGSQLNLTSGVGGSSGSSTGGTGGSITLTAGAGGATSGSATTAGAGAAASLVGGAGGSGASGTNANGGAGGNIVIKAGAGGAASGSGTAGAAGKITIQDSSGNNCVTLGFAGIQANTVSVAITTGTTTLSAAQYSRPYIILTGSLSGSVTLVFPADVGAEWIIDATAVTLNAHTITAQANSNSWATTIGVTNIYQITYGGTGKLYGTALTP